MGTALNRVDVVYVGINLLRESGIILESYLNRDYLIGFKADRFLYKFLCPGIKIIYELLEYLF